MKNSECTIEQYRGDTLVRTFTPSGDSTRPWSMNVDGKSYLRTNGWVLSKVLPTLVEGSPITTKVIAHQENEPPDPQDDEPLAQLAAIHASLESLTSWAAALQEGYEGFDNTEHARRYETVRAEFLKATDALAAARLQLQSGLSPSVGVLPPPAFGLGQWVKTKPPRTERVGRICELIWHHNEDQYGYFLEIEAKPYKTRYWAHELEALPPTERGRQEAQAPRSRLRDCRI